MTRFQATGFVLYVNDVLPCWLLPLLSINQKATAIAINTAR